MTRAIIICRFIRIIKSKSFAIVIKLMDPRPYNYEFRKPRLSNPTYQSGRLYESIYHLGSFSRMNPNVDKLTNNYPPPLNSTPARQRANQLLSQRVRNIDPNAYDLGKPVASQEQYPTNTYRKNSSHHQEPESMKYHQNYMQQNKNGRNYQQNRHHDQRNHGQDRNYDQRNYGKERNPPSTNQEVNRNYNEQHQGRNYEQKNRNYDEGRNYEDGRNYENNNRMNYGQGGNSDKRDTDNNGSRNYERGQPRSYSQDSSVHMKKDQKGYMSNYGSTIMRPMPGRDQDTVYQRQQKPYNIISCYPREVPNIHRKFPRLTLEDKLIETGQYGYNPEGF